MLEPEVPAAEEYRQAFQQHLEWHKRHNQTLILLLANARMQADLYSLYQETQPRASPLRRLCQRLSAWLRHRSPAASAGQQAFPWGLHGYYVVHGNQPTHLSQTKEFSPYEQTSAVTAQDDSAANAE